MTPALSALAAALEKAVVQKNTGYRVELESKAWFALRAAIESLLAAPQAKDGPIVYLRTRAEIEQWIYDHLPATWPSSNEAPPFVDQLAAFVAEPYARLSAPAEPT